MIHFVCLQILYSKEGIKALKDKSDELSMNNLQLKYHINNLEEINQKHNLHADRKTDEIVKLQNKVTSMTDEYNKIGKLIFGKYKPDYYFS